MSKKRQQYLVLLLFAVFIALVAGVLSDHGHTFMFERSFTAIKPHYIRYYYHDQNCQIIAYNKGSYASSLKRSCVENALHLSLSSFRPTSKKIYDRLGSYLMVYNISNIRIVFGRGRQIVRAEFVKQGWFYDITYVYIPNYGPLPVSNNSKVSYKSINNDWYRVNRYW